MNYNNKKILLLISLGSILEYYDFAIFIYLAPMVGKALIPINNGVANLILSYAIFAVGAVFRPLGGLIFAHIGDTRGRRHTFIYTILLMAIPTFLIAFIPSAENIGVFATVLLVFLRVTQGLALGGEIPGSIVFGYELSKREHKAISSSVIIMGTNFGFFLASIICTYLISITNLGFESWRLAFVIGGLFGFVSYFLRKSLSETPSFNLYLQVIEKEKVPYIELFKKYKIQVFQLLGLGCFLASSLALYTFFMPTYLSKFYNFPLHVLMEYNSFTIILFVLGSLLAGFFDKFFAKKFFIICIVVLSIATLILFNLYDKLSLTNILIIHSFILPLIGIICGRVPVLCATFFPVNVRYTGVAIIYNISFGIIAGFSQMILTWLISLTGLLWVPALYLAFFACLALISMFTIKNSKLINYID